MTGVKRAMRVVHRDGWAGLVLDRAPGNKWWVLPVGSQRALECSRQELEPAKTA